MDEISIPKPQRRRRHHSREFKTSVIAACHEPGASVARVALEHGLNDNLVRRWIKEAQSGPVSSKAAFVPLALPAPPPPAPAPTPSDEVIRIDVPRTAGTVTITWPATHADRAMVLLRELLL